MQSQLLIVFLYKNWVTFFSYVLILCSMCFKKDDRRADAETRARALIEEDYRKLGPLKWGLVYVFKSHEIDNEFILWPSVLLTFTLLHAQFSVLQREQSLSFLYCLLFSCLQEIPNLSPDGLCFLKKGKNGTLTKNTKYFAFYVWWFPQNLLYRQRYLSIIFLC